ncbi:hypothetical protein LOTGIDRAFT_107463 [Lottia gigantea]|uniref:Uncharacterized protein n=1 Tax=Lottia gigantea TaxID=225164 RepID=V3ZXE7_LOTGI|nr:hypothetical protein LOTGIDRAFT_107463 [Lottia gigantea]ESO87295.1 hypothetical protein LOTGIDRAFT_107463 [Lottia gigantea]
MFSLRIVTTDHYLATPIPGLDVTRSEFRGTEVKKVPILRIFGSTPAGQKTCMHVHGVFPYLYVPFDGTHPEERYMKQFAASLDKALNVGNGMAKANFQHVFKISLVSGIPMYGYHHKEEAFMKIYLYNPFSVKKAADLLLGGAVMNKSFQPHESHIPYQLQLFIDFNLYGMNMINVAAVKFRHRNIKGFLLLMISLLRYMIEGFPNIGTNPGLAALWEDERQRRRDRGEDSQLEPQDSQGISLYL